MDNFELHAGRCTMTAIDSLISDIDWSLTAVGPPQTWPQSLQVAFNICRTSRFPIILFWGSELTQLYNDAYIPVLGSRHPAAFGQRARDCWPEIWDAIGPMLDGVMISGKATWSENLLLPLERYGAPEECYFTFSYSPIDNGEQVGGVFCAVMETTATVLREREARERAEALAELDRAKSEFFNNVSHEFRTPLTLMLGPLESLALAVDFEQRPLLELVQRNALRLLKLVNTLLQFARIESGRRDASFVKTDLALLTTDLASGFRSAIERAGLSLEVSADLAERAFVDRSMWERIVLNLLSNALKFTLNGSIRVELRAKDGAAQLAVTDTGVGIPQGELRHIFERFYRLRGAPARSYEGSGIGLALTAELVRLHGGSIAVESELGRGTSFYVKIPLGSGHLDPEQIVSELQAEEGTSLPQYLADIEAAIENTGEERAPERLPEPPAKRARVLFADDNRDLRDYVSHVLSAFHDVVTVKNGREALEAAKSGSFDLVVSDAMMPDMDGLALLKAVRSDEALAALPFILLSARAGEESVVDGLRRGADDYLAKPFTAEELVVRVGAQLRSTRRQEAYFEQRTIRRWFEQQGESGTDEVAFRAFANQLPIPIWQQDIFGSVSFTNTAWYDTLRLPRDPTSHTGEAWKSVIHPEDFQATLEVTTAAIVSRDAFELNYRLKPSDGDDAAYRWHTARAIPQFDAGGEFKGWIGSIIDVHEARLREDVERRLRLEASRALANFQALADSIPHIVYTRRPGGALEWANRRFFETTQLPPALALEPEGWRQVMPPEDFESIAGVRERGFAASEPYEVEIRIKAVGAPESAYRWHLFRAVPMRDPDGTIVRWACTGTDIHDRRVADAERERDLRALSEALPTIVWTAAPSGAGEYFNRRLTEYSGLSPAQAAGDGWLSIVHPDDIEAAAETWRIAVAEGSAYEVSYRLRRKDGEYRWFSARGLPISDAAGAIVRWIGTCSDIDDAKRSYDRERRVSGAFQEAALPKSLPNVPGLTFSAIYRAGSAEAFVGGDWYDAFALTDGRVVLSVGDVMGTGLNAAVMMSAVRQSIRGAAQIDPDPCAVVAAADRALRSEHPEAIVTAFVGIFDPVIGTFAYASAGHPPPFLRDDAGDIVALRGSGPPLGLRSQMLDPLPQKLLLPAGPSMLVLYTDGFTEATRDIQEGEERLRRAMASEAVIKSPDAASEIVSGSLDEIHDDVAILVVRFGEIGVEAGYSGNMIPSEAPRQFYTSDDTVTRTAR